MNKYTKVLLTTFYLVIVCFMVVGSILVVNGIKAYSNVEPEKEYTIKDVFDKEEETISVSKIQDTTISKPYSSKTVEVKNDYYDSSSNENIDSSIIFFEDTYFQNQGINYTDNDDFDILAIYDGEVISIEDNSVYGKVLKIKHNNNLISTYSNIDNILVSVGYKVTKGEIIATSGYSNLTDENVPLLHFEISYKEENINPKNIYDKDINEFN